MNNQNNKNYSKKELEHIVVMTRLHFYNRGLSCGARVIRRELEKMSIAPLISVNTIHRILQRQYLTHRRTGYYKEDYM